MLLSLFYMELRWLKNALMVVGIVGAIAACARVGFNAGANDSANATGGPGNDLPKVQFISPSCPPKANCPIEFRLDKVYSAVTEFDWHTDDTLYKTAHTPIYGRPNVHYIATSGHVTFQPGETSKSTFVQNINGDNYEILIGTLINGCLYGTQSFACASFFH